MACSARGEPGNHLLPDVVEEATGQVAAPAIFGPELELLVTASDGRRWRFPVPEFDSSAVARDGETTNDGAA
jgi:hypothetical protein